MKVAYLDIETNYVGPFKSNDDRFFRDSKNHLITLNVEHRNQATDGS